MMELSINIIRYMLLNIPVICGSVRSTRKSIMPAQYIHQQVTADGHDSQIVDFTVLKLPFVDSAESPSKLKKEYPYEVVKEWSAIADKADGFVFVSPEYNHSIPGVLKNALDWLSPEFGNKPAALVGVSNGAVGGARMVEHLRAVVENFGMWGLQKSVLFKKVQDVFDESGNLVDDAYATQVRKMLDSLYQKSEVLKALRE